MIEAAPVWKLTNVEMVATDRIDDAIERYLGPSRGGGRSDTGHFAGHVLTIDLRAEIEFDGLEHISCKATDQKLT